MSREPGRSAGLPTILSCMHAGSPQGAAGDQELGEATQLANMTARETARMQHVTPLPVAAQLAVLCILQPGQRGSINMKQRSCGSATPAT